jgi:hypothetical protein
MLLVACVSLAGSLVGDGVIDAVKSDEGGVDPGGLSPPSPLLSDCGAPVCSGGGGDGVSVAGGPPSCLLKAWKLCAVAS